MKEAISDQIITAASTLFYREGIRAVGIDRIIEEAKVAKATLYRHFPSKDHLVAAYLSARHELVIQSLTEVLSSALSPREQIHSIFGRLYDKADSPDLRGKPILLTATGGGDRHSLMVEHQLRPLFAFFEAFVTPTAIYASSRDFVEGLPSPGVSARVDQALNEASLLFQLRSITTAVAAE